MPEYPLLPSEADSQTLYWLLSVTWMGRTFRWATEAIGILNNDGETLEFAGGLSLSFTEKIDFFGGSATVPSVSVRDLDFPVDVAEMIELGHPLVRAPTELALWAPGRGTYEDAIVYMKGKLTLTDYGAVGEPVGFTLVPDGIEGSVLEPQSTAIINATTWPDRDPVAEGKYYPTVIGKPGFAQGVTTGINGGSPAMVVDDVNDYLLVAGHPVAATANVRIIDRTDLVGAVFTPDTRVDGLGRQVTTVTLGGAVPYVAGNEYWAHWVDSEGGLENPWVTGECLEGLGDVIRWALNRGGITADVGRWLSIRDALSGYKVATYLDRPTDLWAWVTRGCLPLAPISILTGSSGLYPVLWSADVLPSEVRADIDVQRDGLERSSPVRYEDGEWATIQRVRYAPRSDNGKPHKVVTASGEYPIADPTVIPSVYLRAAYNVLGAREGKALELTTVYSKATAQKVAGWRSIVFAMPWRTVQYHDLMGKLSWLRAGAPVTLTDDDIHLSSQLCWLASVSWRDTVPTYTFAIISDLVRDTRQ